MGWKTILDEEPFEGQHWEGVYGLPPGSTVEGWETRSLDSTPPYSPLPLGNPSDLSPSLSSTDSLPSIDEKSSLSQDDSARMATMSSFGHRQLIEDLRRRQYWRTEYQTDAASTSPFAVKNASSLGTLSNCFVLNSCLIFFVQDPRSISYWPNGTRSSMVSRPKLSAEPLP